MEPKLITYFKIYGFLILLFGALSSLQAQQWDTLTNIPAEFTFPVVAVANGQIHVMGGGGPGGATTLHYAYDPGSDSWSPKANVPYAAQQPAGAYADGKIHFFGGGFPNTGSPLADHHIYDVSSNTWSPGADLTAARAIHYSVAVNDVVYSLAGQGVTNLCQSYDSANDEWITHNNLPDNSFWYGAHVVTEGKIYRFCGGGFTAPVDHAHQYNPGFDSWTPLPDFPNATHGLRGAAIGNNIYLTGGYYNFLERDELWVYDIQSEQYSQVSPSLPLGRNYHNLVAIDSCLYVVGGYHAIDNTVRTQLLRYCPQITTQAKNMTGPQKIKMTYVFGTLHFNLPEGIADQAEFSLFDLAGRQIYSKKLTTSHNNRFELRIGDLMPGTYFVHLSSEKKVFTSSFIVQ